LTFVICTQARQAAAGVRVELERTIRELRGDVDSARDTHVQLQTQLERAQAAAQTSKQQQQAAEAALVAITDDKEQLDEKQKSHAETLARLQQQLDAARAAAEQARGDSGGMIAQLNTEIERLKLQQLEQVCGAGFPAWLLSIHTQKTHQHTRKTPPGGHFYRQASSRHRRRWRG
jgi:chromosome segregation ATPase